MASVWIENMVIKEMFDKNLLHIPRVSILMTVYNGARFLHESIDSILEQTFQDWELIVVEDCSTDTSPSILLEYSDPRIRLFQMSKNIGRTPALRFGLNKALGEYIAVLDQDDISHPERIERQVSFLDNNHNVVLVASWAKLIDENGQMFGIFEPPIDKNTLYDRLGYANPIVHSSTMYRKNSVLDVGGYPGQYSFAQDYALILKLSQIGTIAIIDEHLCRLRVFKGSMTTSARHRMIVSSEKLLLYKHAANNLFLSKRARRLNRRAIAICEVKCGLAMIMNNSVFSGLKVIFFGIYKDPTALWKNGKIDLFKW